MKLSQKVTTGLLALVSVLVLTAIVAFYSTASLSGLLNFITTTAWDTADGAMEGSIGIEAQMLAVERMTSGQDEGAEALLEEGQELADEALNRMASAGLMSNEEVGQLNRDWSKFNEQKEQYLQSYQEYTQAKKQLEKTQSDFQLVMINAEELGDGQVEELEENPNKLYSWSSGLSEKWSAADGAMEAQIHFLGTAYYFQRFIASGADPLEKERIKESISSLGELINEINGLRVFRSSTIPEGNFKGQPYAKTLVSLYEELKDRMSTAVLAFEEDLRARQEYIQASNQLLSTIEQIEETADGKVEGEAATVSFTQNLAYTLCFIALILGLLIAYFGRSIFHRNVIEPIELLTSNMKLAAKNEQTEPNDLDERDDEIGEIATALKVFIELFDENQKISDQASRVTSALQVAKTNLMIADNDFNIIYLNDTVQEMFKNAEEDLRKDLPKFSADALMGENIDIFHKNPSHQRQLLSALTGSHEAVAKVGGRTFRIFANPVINQDKRRLGTVVEWIDETEMLRQKAIEQEEAAENARLKQALDNVSANVMVTDADRNIIYMNPAVISTFQNAESQIKNVHPGFNTNALLGEPVDTLPKFPKSQIDLTGISKKAHEASIEIGGRHLDLTVNSIVDGNTRLGTVVEWFDKTDEVMIQQEVDHIVRAASAGDLGKRVELSGKEGFFLELSNGLNEVLSNTDSFIKDLNELFRRMAEGDLSQSLTQNYHGDFNEIANNANATLNKLCSVLSDISSISQAVNTSSGEISQGSFDLRGRTESQASSLEETASSMEEITATVQESEKKSTEASNEAAEAKQRAEAGGLVVQQAVDAMREISDSSNKINDIIGVIDEIAFQTNLLALNAAVEAARAGEQGRGFAVVAGEVRTLSQRSASAAKEIKDLIRDSVSKVDAGSQLVNQTGDTLSGIVAGVETVASRIASVSEAAKEQSNGITQINQAITQMDNMTQQNAALVEETEAAAMSMRDQAAKLRELIGFFKTG